MERPEVMVKTSGERSAPPGLLLHCICRLMAQAGGKVPYRFSTTAGVTLGWRRSQSLFHKQCFSNLYLLGARAHQGVRGLREPPSPRTPACIVSPHLHSGSVL